jgi:hypothetical protein
VKWSNPCSVEAAVMVMVKDAGWAVGGWLW